MAIKENTSEKPLSVGIEESAKVRGTTRARKGRFADMRRRRKDREAIRKNKSEEYVSANIVKLLRETRNMRLKEIGEIIERGESFICRVGKGERAFTLKHLALLERHLGVPLPLLLLDSVDEASLSDEMRSLYRSFRSRIERTSKPDSVQSH